MLECINNQCDDCKEFKCTREICSERINPDHTPNYAEEQLEYAKENRTNLMEQVKKCVNYEEGYWELLKENEKLNKTLEDALKEKNWKVGTFTEYNNLKYEKSEYERINKNLSEELKNSDIKNRNMKTEIINLNQLIEKKDIKIEKLEQEVKSLKEIINEGNEQLTNEYFNKIIIAEQEINRLNTEVACLKAFKEKDNKQIQNLKDAVKKLAEVL